MLYGRGPDELIGANATRFAIEPLAPELLSEIGGAILNGRSWEGEFRVERADGTTVDVHAVDSPVFDDSGAGVGRDQPRGRRDRAAHSRSDELRRVLAVAQILRDIGADARRGARRRRR